MQLLMQQMQHDACRQEFVEIVKIKIRSLVGGNIATGI